MDNASYGIKIDNRENRLSRMAKLIFGCGYLGRRVAERWRDMGHDVYVVTRSSERAQALAASGLTPIVADVMTPASLVDLPNAETVLYSVGFDRTAGHSIAEVYVGGLANVLMRLPVSTGRLIYISSTGVYGATDGELVDEDSPCRPQRDGGRACLEAEALIDAAHASRVGPRDGWWTARSIVLRMAGIYGPGRIPRQRELLAGEPLDAPQQGFLNLIHVDDAANAALAAERVTSPQTYNVSDGHPAQRREYYQEVARLIGAPAPRFADSPVDSGVLTPARDRAISDKRVSNARMLRDLLSQLRYPTYREGLAAALAAEKSA